MDEQRHLWQSFPISQIKHVTTTKFKEKHWGTKQYSIENNRKIHWTSSVNNTVLKCRFTRNKIYDLFMKFKYFDSEIKISNIFKRLPAKII